MTTAVANPTGSNRTAYASPASRTYATRPVLSDGPCVAVITARATAATAGVISTTGSPRSRTRSKSVFGSGSGEPI